MKIFSKTPNSIYAQSKSSPSFGAKAIPFDDVIAVARRASCEHGRFSKIYNDLVEVTRKKAPELIENVDGLFIPKEEKFSRKFIEAGRDFLELPFDWADDIVSHFPNSRLRNSRVLQKHRTHILEENKVKAFQGLFDYGDSFLKSEKVNKHKIVPSATSVCSEKCQQVCSNMTDEFNSQMNKAAELNKAIYDSKKERFDTRIISGVTAALFLGNDYYNSAVLKGKSEEEAKEQKRKKQGQEIKESVMEGFAQYGAMACFAKLSSTSIAFNVASGVGVSTIARIISRKTSGMRLTRMDVPENSMNEFVKAAKNGTSYKTQSEKNKDAKKPILSLRNLALLSAGIIATGFLLKAGKKTKIGGKITSAIERFQEKSYRKSIETIWAKPDELQNMADIFKKHGEEGLGKAFEEIASNNATNEAVKIGEKYKVIKLPFGLTITQRALKKTLFTPFRMIKEFVTYPYKLASNIADAFTKSKAKRKLEAAQLRLDKAKKAFSEAENPTKKSLLNAEVQKANEALDAIINQAKKGEKKTGSERLSDDLNIKNIYIRYKKFEEKFGSDPKRLEEEFGKYIETLRAASLNNKTSSKIDNSRIAVLAQITGTLSGMWFNMNDEFNAAVTNGADKQEAEKAARKRGLHKFTRMTTQAAISDALNKLFKAQYQGSLFGAGVIVAISTIITDMASRVLNAMPTKKMQKDELEQYQKDLKEGSMAWYYKLVDKLAS